jgi:hypothetical protein
MSLLKNPTPVGEYTESISKNATNFHTQHCDGFHCEFSRPSYFRVLDSGKYFYPAWKHYGRPVAVACDRCGKSGLRACIGFGQQDLCMVCVEELTSPFSHCTHCDDPFCN